MVLLSRKGFSGWGYLAVWLEENLLLVKIRKLP